MWLTGGRAGSEIKSSSRGIGVTTVLSSQWGDQGPRTSTTCLRIGDLEQVTEHSRASVLGKTITIATTLPT